MMKLLIIWNKHVHKWESAVLLNSVLHALLRLSLHYSLLYDRNIVCDDIFTDSFTPRITGSIISILFCDNKIRATIYTHKTEPLMEGFILWKSDLPCRHIFCQRCFLIVLILYYYRSRHWVFHNLKSHSCVLINNNLRCFQIVLLWKV